MATRGIELIVLIGLQASGKSTFRGAHFDARYVIVSKDLLRNNRRPNRRQARLIREALSAERSVVVDNTNVRVEDRAELIGLAREFSARVVGYFLPISVSDSLTRNALREGRARVPDVGIRATAKALVLPTWSEGFDQLFEVTLEPVSGFVIRAFPRNCEHRTLETNE